MIALRSHSVYVECRENRWCSLGVDHREFFCILFLLLNSYLEDLCIAQKFESLVSDSMLSSCWGAIFYRPLLTNTAAHNCAILRNPCSLLCWADK